MDRTTPTRRSTGRFFWSPSSGSSALGSSVDEFRLASKQLRNVADTQMAAAENLLKWSLKEPNCGVQDVAYQTRELFDIFGECQRRFTGQLEASLTQLDSIKEADRSLARADKTRKAVESEEAKLRRELRRVEKWGKGGDAALVQHKLREASVSRDLVERRHSETRAEQEVVKMFRLRGGLESLAAAYAELGRGMTAVFSAAADVAHQLPAITTEDITTLSYFGAPLTQDRVSRVRADLGLQRRPDPARSKRRASAPASVNRSQRKVFDSSAVRAYVQMRQKEGALGCHTGDSHDDEVPRVLSHAGSSASGGVGGVPAFETPPPPYAPMDPAPQASSCPMCQSTSAVPLRSPRIGLPKLT